MKNLLLIGLFLWLGSAALAQVDYCTETKKAIKAAENNFSTYTNFQYNTVGGQKAYLADFSFISGQKGYIYFDAAKNKTDFFQTITTDATRYTEIYKGIEKCLVSDDNYWTKFDNDKGTTVIFSCAKTGAEVSLVSGDKGVTIIIDRLSSKNLPVFTASFCSTLKNIAKDAGNNFSSFIGAYYDSSILGKAYKSTQQLNQRGVSANITIGKSWIKPGTMDYTYSEMVAGSELSPAEVMGYFDACLTKAEGWQKGKQEYGDGIVFSKGDVEVTLTTSKAYSYKEADNSHISIKKKTSL